jgi:hypothetical protein
MEFRTQSIGGINNDIGQRPKCDLLISNCAHIMRI